MRKVGLAALLPGLLVGLLMAADYENPYSSGSMVIGGLLFGVAALGFIALPFCTWRGRAVTLVTMAMLYLGSYCVLSANGDYIMLMSGKVRYKPEFGGLAMYDTCMWQPRWMRWQPFVDITVAKTPIGYFYSPLIWCDQEWMHPTISVFEKKG